MWLEVGHCAACSIWWNHLNYCMQLSSSHGRRSKDQKGVLGALLDDLPVVQKEAQSNNIHWGLSLIMVRWAKSIPGPTSKFFRSTEGSVVKFCCKQSSSASFQDTWNSSDMLIAMPKSSGVINTQTPMLFHPSWVRYILIQSEVLPDKFKTYRGVSQTDL